MKEALKWEEQRKRKGGNDGLEKKTTKHMHDCWSWKYEETGGSQIQIIPTEQTSGLERIMGN